MSLIALAVLVCTALSGLALLGAWFRRDDVRRARTGRGRHRRLPPVLVLSHVSCALAGAVTWVEFSIVDHRSTAVTSLLMLVLAAALGVTMFVRWIPSYRRRSAVPAVAARPAGRGGAHRMPTVSNLPITVVISHGVFAVATVILMAWVVFRP